MDAAVWPSVIAVVGTLAGGLVAGGVQARSARVARRESRRDTRRAEVVAAVTALVAALADHRRAMWVMEDLRLSGAAVEIVTEARDTTHVTRSAVTAPVVTVSILAPELAVPAREAERAAYAMRNAADLDSLERLRQGALDASNRLVELAAEFFTPGRSRRWSS